MGARNDQIFSNLEREKGERKEGYRGNDISSFI